MKKIGENGEALGVEVRAKRCKNQTCFQKIQLFFPTFIVGHEHFKGCKSFPTRFQCDCLKNHNVSSPPLTLLLDVGQKGLG